MLKNIQRMSANSHLKILTKILLRMDDAEKMINFLHGLLTEKEIIELATRLEIIHQLKQGISQHKIAQDLGVGVATVTRGSKELQKGNFNYVS